MPRNRSDDSDDDDYDDRPRKRRRQRDDDDDDDYRPKRKSKGNDSGGLVWIIIGFGILVLAGLGIAGFLLLRSEPMRPEVVVAEKQDPDAAVTQDNTVTGVKSKADGNAAGGTDAGKLPVGVVSVPSLTPTVTQVVFGGGEDGFAAIVANKLMGAGYIVDVVKAATGKAVGQIKTDNAADRDYAISPDGNMLAVLRSKPFEGNSVSLFSVANGQEQKQFTPYPKGSGNITAPDLIWISFVSKELLITINSGGGFDLWSVPDLKRTAGIAASLKAGNRIDVNGFTHSPKNFSLSIDGKSLVIFNGSGFSFYETETAKEAFRTKDVMKPGNSILASAAAFSPDGKRFASYYQTFGEGAVTSLSIWDSKTGNLLSSSLQTKSKAPAGFAWWGSNHLLFWEGGIATGTLQRGIRAAYWNDEDIDSREIWDCSPERPGLGICGSQ